MLITAAELAVILWIAIATYYHSRWFPLKSSNRSFRSIFISKLDYIIKVTTAQGKTTQNPVQIVILYRVMLQTGDYLPCSARLSIRIPAALWCLMTVVFVNAYTGSIASFIAIPRRAAIPNSVAEVAASSNESKMTAEAKSAQLEAFHVSLS